MTIHCSIHRRTALLMVGILMLGGCAEGAKLVQDTPFGRVVSYVYKDHKGVLFSRYRKEALDVISKKCPAGYTILTEGEIRAHSSVSGVEGADDDGRGRRWALQFRCKSA